MWGLFNTRQLLSQLMAFSVWCQSQKPQSLWFSERRREEMVLKTEFLETSVISFSVKQQCTGPTQRGMQKHGDRQCEWRRGQRLFLDLWVSKQERENICSPWSPQSAKWIVANKKTYNQHCEGALMEPLHALKTPPGFSLRFVYLLTERDFLVCCNACMEC